MHFKKISLFYRDFYDKKVSSNTAWCLCWWDECAVWYSWTPSFLWAATHVLMKKHVMSCHDMAALIQHLLFLSIISSMHLTILAPYHTISYQSYTISYQCCNTSHSPSSLFIHIVAFTLLAILDVIIAALSMFNSMSTADCAALGDFTRIANTLWYILKSTRKP